MLTEIGREEQNDNFVKSDEKSTYKIIFVVPASSGSEVDIS